MLNNPQSMSAVRACIDTPFHHQGRSPGVGIDCIGLIIIAMIAANIKVNDRTDYGRRPDKDSLINALEEHGATPIEKEAARAGDVLVFRYDNQPQHVALATSENTMIHSFAPAGKVVETHMGDYWKRRIVTAYRFESQI